MDERPIRPAGEAVLRAFAGENVGRDQRVEEVDSDDEDDEYTRQVSFRCLVCRPSSTLSRNPGVESQQGR